MKAVARIVILSGAALGGFSIVGASTAEASTKPWLQFPGATPPVEFSFGAGYGTRTGDLRWNIAGGDSGPNILSELTYKGLQFTEYRTNASLKFNSGVLKNWRIDTNFSAGQADQGKAYDSDFDEDNRQGEYSRSVSSLAGSEATNFDASLGYSFHPSESLTLTPQVGFVYNTQFLKMTEGEQLLYTRSGGVRLGDFANELNSHYSTKWTGGFVGMLAGYEGQHQSISIGYKLHVAGYEAEANWNLREDFQHPRSFSQTAVALGNVVELNYQWHVTNNWSLKARAFNESWTTQAGNDTVYLSNGTTAGSRLNEVTWDSTGYDLGMQYLF